MSWGRKRRDRRVTLCVWLSRAPGTEMHRSHPTDRIKGLRLEELLRLLHTFFSFSSAKSNELEMPWSKLSPLLTSSFSSSYYFYCFDDGKGEIRAWWTGDNR